jgi:methionyl-tRNA synthetase
MSEQTPAENIAPVEVQTPVPEKKAEISYDDFAKLDIRIGTVVAVEKVENADKLLKCTIDFGAMGTRTIVSGIAEWKQPEDLVGRQLPYIVNLAPRMLRGVESQGMLIAASDEKGVALIQPEREVPQGTKLK